MCHLRSDIWQFIFSKSKDLSAAISGCPDSQAGLQSFDVTTNFPSLWMCVCNCGHVHICAGDIELLSRLSSSWSQYQGCDWHDCQCRKPSWQDGQVGHCFGSQGEGNDQESRSAAGRSWQVVAVRPAIGHFQSPAFWNTSGKGSRQREHKPNAHGRRDTAWCWRWYLWTWWGYDQPWWGCDQPWQEGGGWGQCWPGSSHCSCSKEFP